MIDFNTINSSGISGTAASTMVLCEALNFFVPLFSSSPAGSVKKF